MTRTADLFADCKHDIMEQTWLLIFTDEPAEQLY